MKTIRIPKKNGSFRLIYVPSRDRKQRLRALLPELNEWQQAICDPAIVHAFFPGHSAITNAMAHIGYAYSLSFDLSDFFDTITADKVDRLSSLLSHEIRHMVVVDGAARQGLPTSPAIANIVAASMDKVIQAFLHTLPAPVVYTRYADDLTFSYSSYAITPLLVAHIPTIVTAQGFMINPHKTQLQFASKGRRMICGIAVDDDGIHATRASKRHLRAAEHHAKTEKDDKKRKMSHQKAHGLKEWTKLKVPRTT